MLSSHRAVRVLWPCGCAREQERATPPRMLLCGSQSKEPENPLFQSVSLRDIVGLFLITFVLYLG